MRLIDRLIDSIRRHSLVTSAGLVSYFVLTFLISWGMVLAVILPTTGIRLSADADLSGGSLFVLVSVAMLLGPAIAGLLLTALLGGRPALRELRSRLTLARVPGRYFWFLALAPALMLAVVIVLAAFEPAYLPTFLSDPAVLPMVAFGVVYAFLVGIFEELGWTGFATPRLIDRYGVVRGAIVLGVLWSMWHWVVTYWGASERYGDLFLLTQASAMVQLTSYRVIMTVLYAKTGSVLFSQLLHAPLTVVAVIYSARTTPEQDLLSGALFTLAILIAAILVAGGVRLPAARRLRPA